MRDPVTRVRDVNVTRAEIEELRETVHFYGLPIERISLLLQSQLAAAAKLRVYDVDSVTRVIRRLESADPTVRASPFERKPLKGLFKAHFMDARFILFNLRNEWSNRKVAKASEDAIAAEAENPSAVEWQGRLAHALTVEAYERRAEKGALTGEWIIYGRAHDVIYYLGVFAHRTGDDLILNALQRFGMKEFPFLFDADGFPR